MIEERFGFNKMTPKLFFVDLVKSLLLGAVLLLPLIAAHPVADRGARRRLVDLCLGAW